MSVYISTGGFKNLDFLETARLFKESGINNIELSGGAHTGDVKKNFVSLISLRTFSFIIIFLHQKNHSY